MRAVIGALTLASYFVCFDAAPRLVYNNKESGKNTITIAYLLNGFTYSDTLLNSKVGFWLKGIQDQAVKELKTSLGVDVTFEITDSKVADADISYYVNHWTSGSQVHSTSFLNYLKRESAKNFNPDIICVLLKGKKIYGDNFRDKLGYSMHNTLCHGVVPMLLTYKENDVQGTGKLLAELVTKSTQWSNADTWKTKTLKEKNAYFEKCAITYKLPGATDDDEDYVLPVNKDYFYSDGEKRKP
uniref:Ixodes 26 kDa salivary protein n=1 Tax=Ixodes ricinus TaxID=34613 RepID=V5HP08_IXORI